MKQAESSTLNCVLDSCESTQDVLKASAKEGAPHGSWISALEQTKGRGRLGRDWSTERGNLALSFLVRGVPENRLSWVGVMSGVLIHDAIVRVSPVEAQAIKLKWPNDLWRVNQNPFAKIAGVLGESAGSALIIGVGVNTVGAPQGLDLPASKLDCDTDQLRSAICNELFSLPEILSRLSVDELKAQFWPKSLFRVGNPVVWAQGQGEVLGLGDFGELLVKTADSKAISLFAEDVRALRPGV